MQNLHEMKSKINIDSVSISEVSKARKHSGHTRSIIKKQAIAKAKPPLSIIAVFVVFLWISVATSKGLASLPQNKELSVIPSTENAISQQTPKLNVITQPNGISLAVNILNDPIQTYEQEANVPNNILERRKFLEKYLRSKNSVLADHVETLADQSQWRLIVGISRAESSFCKRHAGNNCWGIGGAWNLKKYKNYDEAIIDVNRILESFYVGYGLNTPKKIVNKWVGNPSDNWVSAVQDELNVLKHLD